VALLGLDDTAVTLSKGTKAGITIPLVKTFTGFATAFYTVNLTEKFQGNWFANQRIEGELLITDR
jgi:hypothetical protein